MSCFENRVLLKSVLGGEAIVARFITGHEQIQLIRVFYFHFFGVFSASNGFNYSQLISHEIRRNQTSVQLMKRRIILKCLRSFTGTPHIQIASKFQTLSEFLCRSQQKTIIVQQNDFDVRCFKTASIYQNTEDNIPKLAQCHTNSKEIRESIAINHVSLVHNCVNVALHVYRKYLYCFV